MHRGDNKHVRIDDPPPERESPMIHTTPATDHDGQSVHEPEHCINYNAFNPQEAVNSTEYETVENRDRGDSLDDSPPLATQLSKMTIHSGGRGHKLSTSENSEDETSLYFILQKSGVSLNTTVHDWIESYKSNKEAALMQLVQFFVNVSGCKMQITQEMACREHDMIIRKMTEEFVEGSGEYFLIMNGQAWKKFRTDYCDFIQTLIKSCQYSIIYDKFLMDKIFSLLTKLSDSDVPAFRHTATFAIMKLMTALVDVALLESKNRVNCSQQYKAERSKGHNERDTDNLEFDSSKGQKLEENMDEIIKMLSSIYASVVVHRCKDTLPEIRAITMTEIGIWMEKFPAMFLNDSTLIYIGWTLYDKVGDVRLKCLQALQPLYSREELKGKLESFTSKFKNKILDMMLDIDDNVAVQAIKLLISIYKIYTDVLTDSDCELVYECIYSQQRAVRQAAGEFVGVHVFSLNENAPIVKTRRGKQRLPNTPHIRALIKFFIESHGSRKCGAVLVDSLIDTFPMMKDWECMTDLLLEEAGDGEEDIEESVLIDVMICCVRQAATGGLPAPQQLPQNKAHYTQRVLKERQKLAEHFIQTLPLLLEKYIADAEKLSNLVTIPQYFTLDMYSREEDKLTSLLIILNDIVNVHTEDGVLAACSKTLEILCNERGAIYSQCNVARSTIIDMCVNRYKKAIGEWRTLVKRGEVPNKDKKINVTISLKKVSICYMHYNLNSTNIWDSVFDDLSKCYEQTDFPTQALIYCIKCCFFFIIWDLYDVENKLKQKQNADIKKLKDRLHAFVNQCKIIVNSGFDDGLKEMAYFSICDLFVYFSELLYSRNNKNEPAMQMLVYKGDPETFDLINAFVQQFVFVQPSYDYDEQRVSEIERKKKVLVAYGKLISNRIMPITRASVIFKHYVKRYDDYSDIIELILSKAYDIDKLDCVTAMVLSLQSLFTKMLTLYDGKATSEIKNMQEFIDLKELAKRFVLLFGTDVLKNRQAIVTLHCAGITFAMQEWGGLIEDGSVIPRGDPSLPPPNLLFLEIMIEFTNKLLKRDKRSVLQFLDQKLAAGMPFSRSEDWYPLHLYRNFLVHGGAESFPQTTKTKRRKNHRQQDDVNSNKENQGY